MVNIVALPGGLYNGSLGSRLFPDTQLCTLTAAARIKRFPEKQAQGQGKRQGIAKAAMHEYHCCGAALPPLPLSSSNDDRTRCKLFIFAT
jgi:hypothetical protein